jgi:proton-translocating NADH-quinone oxidoreductase chain M
LGVDGISLLFIGLTAFLLPICILASFANIKYRFKEFIILLFLIVFLLFNVFLVLDVFFFYIFFEAILMPMFLLIGIWGSRAQKIDASFEFFYYTLFGSVLLLLTIFGLISKYGTSSYLILLSSDISMLYQCIGFWTFFIAMAVKMPLYPFHIWLPKAHVEAPTAGSVLLAGILLKMGGYGLFRFVIPLFPLGTLRYFPVVFLFTLLGLMYGALSAIRQLDIKRTIAYSSVSHMGLINLGIFSGSLYGYQGSMLSMVSHGIVSSGLFISVGLLYDRYKTKNIFYYGGMSQIMPKYSVIFFIFILANTGFPGTSSFIGELLIFLAIFQISPFLMLFSLSTLITSAAYSFWIYNRVMFGPMPKQWFRFYFGDLTSLEFLTVYPLIFFTIFIGLYPQWLLDILEMTLYLVSVYF